MKGMVNMKNLYLGYEEFIKVKADKPRKCVKVKRVNSSETRAVKDLNEYAYISAEERDYQVFFVDSGELVATITVVNQNEEFYPAISKVSFVNETSKETKIHVITDFLIWFVEMQYELIFVHAKQWRRYREIFEFAGFKKISQRKGCLTHKTKRADAHFFAK